MLEQILDFIHNYFVKEVYRGKFKISGNTLNVDFLQKDQYYRVIGSVFNDGIYKYSSDPLTDEEFTGEVWAMSVPPAVIALAGEIEDWLKKYGDVMNSPFQSESFGGYSYSKGSTGSSNNSDSANAADWRKVFGSRLNAYRKINDRFVIRRYKDEPVD